MNKCDLCHKPDTIQYRVKSIIHKEWIFCCKECLNLISKHIIIPMVVQESQNNKLPCKPIWKNNQIIRALEIYKLL